MTFLQRRKNFNQHHLLLVLGLEKAEVVHSGEPMSKMSEIHVHFGIKKILPFTKL
jgi:hypothetical protein